MEMVAVARDSIERRGRSRRLTQKGNDLFPGQNSNYAILFAGTWVVSMTANDGILLLQTSLVPSPFKCFVLADS